MATLTVRNVPDDLYAALKESAKRNRRSLNQEVIAELAVRKQADNPTEDPAGERAAAHRAELERRIWATPQQIDRFINEGRDRRDFMLAEAAGLGRLDDEEDSRDDMHRRDVALERANAFRKTLEGRVWATEEEIDQFINEGRQ